MSVILVVLCCSLYFIACYWSLCTLHVYEAFYVIYSQTITSICFLLIVPDFKYSLSYLILGNKVFVFRIDTPISHPNRQGMGLFLMRTWGRKTSQLCTQYLVVPYQITTQISCPLFLHVSPSKPPHSNMLNIKVPIIFLWGWGEPIRPPKKCIIR